MVKTKGVQVNASFNKILYKDMKAYSKKYGFEDNLSELIREAIREKIYGKDIKEQITNDFLEQIEKEKDYIFSEKKDLHKKLKNIALRF